MIEKHTGKNSIGIFILLIIIFCSGCGRGNIEQKTDPDEISFEEVFNEEEPSFKMRGFLDANGKKLLDGETISHDDDSVELTFQIGINKPEMEEPQTWGLIWLDDLNQITFLVDDKEYDMYKFSLYKKEILYIHCKLPINENSHEIDYLLVNYPDEKNYSVNADGDEWYKYSVIHEVDFARFQLEGREYLSDFDYELEKVKFSPEIDEFYGHPLQEPVLVDDLKSMNEIDTFPDNDEVYLASGSFGKEYIKCVAIIAFADWKQVPLLDDGNYINYYPADDRSWYKKISLKPFENNEFLQVVQICIYDRKEDMGLHNGYAGPRIKRE